MSIPEFIYIPTIIVFDQDDDDISLSSDFLFDDDDNDDLMFDESKRWGNASDPTIEINDENCSPSFAISRPERSKRTPDSPRLPLRKKSFYVEASTAPRLPCRCKSRNMKTAPRLPCRCKTRETLTNLFISQAMEMEQNSKYLAEAA